MRVTVRNLIVPAILLALGACATMDRAASTTAAAGGEPVPAFVGVVQTAPDGRAVELMVMAGAAPRGVVLFSHGGGSAPEATRALTASFVRQGLAVVAPRHTDSLTLPPERRTTLQAALATRVTDMKLAAGYAAEHYGGRPIAAVGYSYGSLTALIAGGAFSDAIPGAIGGMKAVVMFSSPGEIQPLTSMPGAFGAVTLPSLLVTGTADTVPGFVSDPAKHLLYFDRLPAGDHTALIVTGATHDFLRGDEAGMEEVAPLVTDFLAHRIMGDVAAGRRFDAARTTARVEVRRR